MSEARWYTAHGGDGLEVRRDGSEHWQIYGWVRRNRSCYDAILDRQEESFSIGLFSTKEKRYANES